MATVLLTPQGLLSVSISQKYQVDNILNLDDTTIKTFGGILQLDNQSRYQILYALALNNLLTVPSDDLTRAFQNLNLVGPNSLQWIQKNRSILMAMDELIVSEGSNFKVPLYGLTFTGKRSGLFYFLSNAVNRENVVSNDSFERSFHVFPDKFIGGSDKISDHEGFREKVRSAIEANFILNDTTIEKTFNLIDQVYFSGLLKYRLQAAGKRISFRVSNQMTRTAGSMTHKPREKEYVIAISGRLTEVLGNKLSSGIRINGPVDAFIVTLQHEIVHLIVYLEMDRLGISSNTNNKYFRSHGLHFQNIGERFFGLTERTHRLFEGESESEGEPATPTTNKSQLTVGSRIYFDYKNARMYGTITKLNPKRAKIETNNGSGFSVPYEVLHLA